MRSTVVVYGLQSGGMVFGLSAAILASRIFPADAWGRYALFLSVVGAFSRLIVAWTGPAVLRFGREEWNKAGRLGSTLGTEAVFVVGGCVLVLAAVIFLQSELQDFLGVEANPVVVAGIALIVLPLPQIGIFASQAVGRAAAIGYVPAIQAAAVFGGVVLAGLGLVGASWSTLVWSSVCGAALASGIVFLALPRAVCSGFAPRMSFGRRFISYSWAAPIGLSAAVVMQWVDTWVVFAFHGVRAAGVYDWSYQVVVLGGGFFGTLWALVTPKLIDARLSHDHSALDQHRRFARSVVHLAGAGVCILAPILGPVLRWVVSDDFLAAQGLVPMLVTTLPLLLIGYLMAPVSSAWERLIPVWAGISVVAALLNAVVDLVLVPSIGARGAVVATWSAFLLSALLQVKLYSKHVRVRLLGLRTIMMSACIPACVAVYGLLLPESRWWWLVGGAGCAAMLLSDRRVFRDLGACRA